MMRLITSSSLLLWLSFAIIQCLAKTHPAIRFRELQSHAKRAREKAQFDEAQLEPRAESNSSYRYYNSKTAPYFIKHWPYVPFDAGEFYGGNVPIDESNPNRTLYFIFKPAINGPSNDIVIWLNGGPGCSSLVGFFEENGPILWQAGTYAPTKNPYTWASVANVLWVDEPVGTGFTTGEVRAHGEYQVGQEFAGFFKNWEKLFGIKNYKIYVTGESYAGRYVPYISAAMLDQKDKTYFDLSGALTYDPCIGEYDYSTAVVTSQFAQTRNEILKIDQSKLNKLQALSEKCGFEDYLKKYLTFPPPGNQPPTNESYARDCNTWGELTTAASELNPCYNVYHITDYCPFLGDVLQNPGGVPGIPQKPYFNLPEVKKAIHAPEYIHWSECGERYPFVKEPKSDRGPEDNDDDSPDPIRHVYPQVIEATNRVIIGNADWDGLLMTNGTLLQIQNMTWNGKLGFQTAPHQPVVVPKEGITGMYHYERGLMWVETFQSGHMQPQYQPRTALMHLKWLLGKIDTL